MPVFIGQYCISILTEAPLLTPASLMCESWAFSKASDLLSEPMRTLINSWSPIASFIYLAMSGAWHWFLFVPQPLVFLSAAWFHAVSQASSWTVLSRSSSLGVSPSAFISFIFLTPLPFCVWFHLAFPRLRRGASSLSPYLRLLMSRFHDSVMRRGYSRI